VLSRGHGQEAASELEQLTKLERQVLEAWKNKDADTLQKLLREDYVEVGGPGRLPKAHLMKALGSISGPDYTRDDARLLRLPRDAAILTYQLTPKGMPEKGPFGTPAHVSSAWVRQDNSWRSVFRQWTPVRREMPRLPTINAFEAALTPTAVRYTYKGSTKLEDVQGSLDISSSHGKVTGPTAYFATWDPGEVKEINLGFLAFGVGYIERIDLSAPAHMDGRSVLCSVSSRRDSKIPIEYRKDEPPRLKLQ